MQKSFLSVLSKTVDPVSLRMHIKSAQSKPAKHKKPHEVLMLSLNRVTWKQRRDIQASVNGLQLIKVVTLPSLTVCLDMEQFVLVLAFSVKKHQEFEYSGSYNAAASKASSWTKFHIPNWFAEKVNKQNTVSQCRLFSRQNFVLSLYQALIFAHFKIGWSENWSFTVSFCSKTSL